MGGGFGAARAFPSLKRDWPVPFSMAPRIMYWTRHFCDRQLVASLLCATPLKERLKGSQVGGAVPDRDGGPNRKGVAIHIPTFFSRPKVGSKIHLNRLRLQVDVR